MTANAQDGHASDTTYLSIVAASRNDNHGGNLLLRMQYFIDGLIEQCRRFNISAELILVEWNPPGDRPKLAEALSWPADFGPLSVRIVEVPPEIHARYEHYEALPLFQMIAKNVGILRAKGEFILATNIDILFSDQLMEWIASRKLPDEYFFRVDRYDADEAVLETTIGEDKLEYCANNVIRINQRNGTYYPKTKEFDPIYKSRFLVLMRSISLTLVDPVLVFWLLQRQRKTREKKERGHTRLEFLRRFLSFKKRKQPSGKPTNLGIVNILARVISAKISRNFIRNWRRRYNYYFRRLIRFRKYQRYMAKNRSSTNNVRTINTVILTLVILFRWPIRLLNMRRRSAWNEVGFEFRRRRLHTNSCGDFTMMSKDNWFKLRGYAEFEMYSFHIDSLFCHSAACIGIKELVIEDPVRIYHMEHSEGSGFTPETQQALWTRMLKSKISRLNDDDFWDLTLQMRAKNRSPVFNDENWGLAKFDLPETDPITTCGVESGSRKVLRNI